MLLTLVLLPTLCGSVVLLLNGIALVYGTNYIPCSALVNFFILWLLISLPLCILGTLCGRHYKNFGNSASELPYRVNPIPRPIPSKKFTSIIPVVGLLSFGTIFIELSYIFASLWHYKFYHTYGFLLAAYVMLVVTVAMATTIVVYICLTEENYLWQWISLASGGSTGIYVFLYGIYYFINNTGQTGCLQIIYYFAYVILISLNLGIICGTISHFAASRFVRKIFYHLKVNG